MINIGESINDAIDWTQDFLETTRPLAERTLFSLLAERAVEEGEEGFVLIEAEEEIERHHTKVKNTFSKNWKRMKFHTKRKNAKQRYNSKMKHMHLDNSSAAEGMMAADQTDEGVLNAVD